MLSSQKKPYRIALLSLLASALNGTETINIEKLNGTETINIES